MKYLIKFSYDGSKFNGFQRLNDGVTVQGEIEKALSTIDKREVLLKGAGRTDRGVHAFNQAASFDFLNDVPAERLINAINSIVKPYIYVNSCTIVEDDFHARFSVKRKKYTYKIYTGDYNPLLFNYYEFIKDLDINKMNECIKVYLGGHSFKNFVCGDRDNYDSIVDKAYINVNDNFIEITFEGKGFYRYMIRCLVGSLIEVGKNKLSIDDVKKALDNPNKQTQIYCANAKGLYLEDVIY